MLIVFEGPDCSGKTTLSKNVFDYARINYSEFNVQPENVHLLHFMNNSFLRDFVLNRETRLSRFEETNLFLTDFIITTHKMSEAISDPNSLVFCDRYIFSTLVYQFYASMSNFELDYHSPRNGGSLIRIMILETMRAIPKPDLTFLIKTPKETLEERLKNKKGKDVLEKDLVFMERVRKSYEIIYNEPISGSVTIDGNKNIDELLKDCVREIKKHRK